jgi:hypothetical protein
MYKYTYYQNIHTLQNPYIHTPTHYKTHTHTHTHTNSYITLQVKTTRVQDTHQIKSVQCMYVGVHEYKKHWFTLFPEPDECSDITFTMNLDSVPDRSC